MKISKILDIERNNVDSINLFKEGIFWRCYEYSAWQFVRNIRLYRVFRKYVKSVKQDIVYLGFPESVLEAILNEIKEGGYMVICNDQEIVIKGYQLSEGFEHWKGRIEISNDKEKSSENKQSEIIRRIREYPIITKTPVEAFNFLAAIQKEIYGNL